MPSAESGSQTGFTATTICPFCGMGCCILLRDSVAWPLLHHPVTRGALCLRGWSAGELRGSPVRLLGAAAHGAGGNPVGMPVEEALAQVAEALRRLRNRHGSESIGILGSARGTVEECLALRQLAHALGTPNLDSFQRMGYVPFPSCSLESIEHADRILVVASNLTIRHFQVGRRVLKALERGAEVRFAHARRVHLTSRVTAQLPCLPGHQLEALDEVGEPHLVVTGTEHALCGQGGRALSRLPRERTVFLSDFVNQRGMVESGMVPGPGGLSAWEMLQAAAAGRLKALLVFGDDPFEFFPTLAGEAFARAELTVAVDAVRTATTARARVALPGALLSEKDGIVVNLEGRDQELAAVTAPLSGWTEGRIARWLIDLIGGGDPDLPPPPAPPCEHVSVPADVPSPERPFLVAMDTTSMWSTNALTMASTTAWREARNIHADFPQGLVTINPDDARALGVVWAGYVTLESEDGSITLPARHHPRVLPGTVWVQMHLWERVGSALGALAYDTALRIPVFRPRAVRLARTGRS